MRIALVTCETMPEPDPDQQPLLEALSARGIRTELLSWDAPDSDPAAFDLCVLRSAWNYHERPAAFMDWIDRAARGSRLRNAAAIVRWNVHKRYLLALAADGIPIIPTELVEHGTEPDLGKLVAGRGWNDIVIKPAVSAGSFQTRRFPGASDEAREFLVALTTERDMLVQEYMTSVERGGERALVYVDGAFTHAVHKRPRFAGQDESVSDALPLAQDELLFAERVLARAREQVHAAAKSRGEPIPARPLYGRVDVFRDAAGAVCLSELELVEPSLFLVQSPTTLTRFVDAIEREAHAPPV
jgi:hypothetical protein